MYGTLFLVNEQLIILNESLPIANLMNQVLNNKSSSDKLMIWKDVPFIVLLSAISTTIPIPFTVNVFSTLSNIARFAYHEDEE